MSDRDISLPSRLEALEEVALWDPGNRGCEMLRERGSLAQAAAALARAQRVAITTGFFIASCGVPETDGPPGAIALARTLALLGKSVTIVTDELCANALQEGLARLPFSADVPKSSQALCIVPVSATRSEILASVESALGGRPDAVVSIERLGRAGDGKYYNMRGDDISTFTAPLDELFLDTDACTIGVGDGGNEIGMGNVADAVKQHIPLGERIGATICASHLISAGTSNWGAYALCRAIDLTHHHSKNQRAPQDASTGPSLTPTFEDEAAILEGLVAAGVIDGISKKNDSWVDGLDPPTLRVFFDKLWSV